MSDENKDFDGIRYRAETKSPLLFRVIFGLLIVWAAGFIGYYLFGGWSSHDEFDRKRQAEELQRAAVVSNVVDSHRKEKNEDYVAMGKKEFGERCAACHGVEARGGIGPDLTRKEFKYGKTEQAIAETIAEGRPGG